jgi:hypothetical protein
MLAVLGLAAPLYFASAVAVASAGLLWRLLPEDRLVRTETPLVVPRLHWLDGRVLPFLGVAAALQAVRATTAITLSLFFQDTLGLDAATTVRDAGIGFVVLAISGLFSQLVLVQRLRPTASAMLRAGVPLMVTAFVLLVVGDALATYYVALAALGLGLGLVRPGTSAGASLSVGAHEQGAVAGVMGGLAVVGNVVGPMLATTLYGFTARAPYVMSGAVMTAALIVVVASPRVRALRA